MLNLGFYMRDLNSLIYVVVRRTEPEYQVPLGDGLNVMKGSMVNSIDTHITNTF